MSLKGILLEIPKAKSGYTYPFGFRGILLEYPSGLRFIHVTDYRGIPIEGCRVTVKNAGGNYVQTTDKLGIAGVQIDVSGTVTIDLQKNKTNKSFSYTYSSEGITKIIILQPRLL